MACWMLVQLAFWLPSLARSALRPHDDTVNETEQNFTNFTGIMLDLYRAMKSEDIHKPFGNQDWASLSGVMNYIHTEVVGEHSTCNTQSGHKKPDRRKTRCHSIDSIVQARFFVKNPHALVEEVGSLYEWVDFGRDNEFVHGKATSAGSHIKKYGDYVGVKERNDDRFPAFVPSYWFSLSGACPNHPWNRKYKKKGHPSSGLARGCVMYSDKSGKVRGGQCSNGSLPTGKKGCVYNYVPPTAADVISLDKLAGITQEDCGHRKCQDWRDFRVNCTNKAYKRRFNYNRRRDHTVVHSKVCVEYDVHWECAGKWDKEECREIPEGKRELGLPFWRLRGKGLANMRRIEQLAAGLGVEGAATEHRLVAPQVLANFSTCQHGKEDHLCHPEPDEGGMYCSRHWGGVCQPCFVPGTEEKYERADRDPVCPWSLFQESRDFGILSDRFNFSYTTVSAKGDCPSKEHSGLGAPPLGKDQGPMFVLESDPSHNYESNITRLWLSFDLRSLAGSQVINATLVLHQNIHVNASNTQLFIGRAIAPASGCPRIAWAPSGFEERSAFNFSENGLGPGVQRVSLLHKVNLMTWVREWVTGKALNNGMWIWLGHQNSAAYFDSAVLEVITLAYPFKCATDQPVDLCCLYTATCDPTIPADPHLAPLDGNGFALVSAQQNTEAMFVFLKRIIADVLHTNITDPEGLRDFAYWAWYDHPLDKSLIDVEVDLIPFIKDAPTFKEGFDASRWLQPQASTWPARTTRAVVGPRGIGATGASSLEAARAVMGVLRG